MVASLWGSVDAGTKGDESRTGRVWAAGFHRVTARSRFETYEPFIFFSFPNIFRTAVNRGQLKPRILNPQIRGSASMRFDT